MRSAVGIPFFQAGEDVNRRKDKEIQMQIQKQTKSTKAKPSALSLPDLKGRVSCTF